MAKNFHNQNKVAHTKLQNQATENEQRERRWWEHYIVPWAWDDLLGLFFNKKSRSHPKETDAISGVGP